MKEKQHILIVDDESCIRQFLVQILSQAGFECIMAENGIDALEKLQQTSISLIISDIRMPGLDGIGLLKEIKKNHPFTEIIMATAVSETAKAVEAIKLGAYDYVMKPFDVNTVVASIQRALQKRQLLLENKEYHDRLEDKVRETTAELVEMNAQLRHLFLNTIQSLVHTLEAKDTYTEGHSRRVAEMVEVLARRLGFSDSEVERLHLAAILHDIGKIGVREACLNKPHKLTDAEFNEIKQHPLISERILKPIAELEDILPDIRHHHERYDGKGYPGGRKGGEIPIGPRILAVAYSYDAMTSDRLYRKALNICETLEELQRNIGKQFDPKIVTWFLSIHKELPQMKDTCEEVPSHLTTQPAVLSL